MTWVRQAAEAMTCTGRPTGEPPCPGAVAWVEVPPTGRALCDPHHSKLERGD